MQSGTLDLCLFVVSVILHQLLGFVFAMSSDQKTSLVSRPCDVCGARVPEADRKRHEADVHAVEIAPGVFVGAEQSARCLCELRYRGVATIVGVAAELSDEYGRSAETSDITYRRYAWRDNSSQDIASSDALDLARFVEEEVGLGRRVLIHCSAGMSRAPAAALAYLVLRRDGGMSVDSGLALLRDKKPRSCFPNPWFVKQIRDLEPVRTAPHRIADDPQQPAATVGARARDDAYPLVARTDGTPGSAAGTAKPTAAARGTSGRRNKHASGTSKRGSRR